MAEDIQIEVLAPEQLFGSTTLSLTVRITNLSPEELFSVSVEPVILPGRLVKIGRDDEDAPMLELQVTKRRLVEEMERQVRRAYERNRFRSMSPTERFTVGIRQALDVYTSIFVLGKFQSSRLVPSWATEALRIQEWEDVDRLEKDIISTEKDDSFLRKAFLINKDKLKRCFSQMEDYGKEGNPTDSLGLTDSLLPGASCSYPFTVKAPHALRSKQYDVQFRVTFRKGSQSKVLQRSVGRNVTLFSSAFAVPTGSMIGAACGYAIRSGIKTTAAANATTAFSWPQLGGSVLLGLVLALLTSRKAETKKLITVEDF